MSSKLSPKVDAFRALMKNERVLFAALVIQIVVFWLLSFLMSAGNELVAYQRF